MTPQRIQLSRQKGFNLQEASIALNGVAAVKVDRTTRWGNPFTPDECRAMGFTGEDDEIAERCVAAFTVWLGPNWQHQWPGRASYLMRMRLLESMAELRGKNLACWCKTGVLGSPCHADVLLKLANKQPLTEKQ